MNLGNVNFYKKIMKIARCRYLLMLVYMYLLKIRDVIKIHGTRDYKSNDKTTELLIYVG